VNWEVFITCAVTGAGDTTGRSDRVPVTPAQIATAALDAAKAGAAIAHIHVRDPRTGRGSRDLDLFRDVVERVRSADTDVVVNLTAGMGGDLVLGGPDAPLPIVSEGTDMASASDRLRHVTELKPELCTLDCGTMNFAAGGDYIMVNTPALLRAMAKHVQSIGVRPELEVFDTGHLVMVRDMITEGLIDSPPLIQLCCGIPYGAPADLGTLLAMTAQLPEGAVFSAFAIGRLQLPFVALATNAQLVERAVKILEGMGARLLTPTEVRERLALRRP
jgi:uncharacterized protein (DUF849 family)